MKVTNFISVLSVVDKSSSNDVSYFKYVCNNHLKETALQNKI